MEEAQPEKLSEKSAERSKRISARKKRVAAVAVIIIVIAIVVAFWGSQPQRTYTPSDVLAAPQDFVGKTIQIRGLAMSVDPANNTFVLGDFVVNLTVRVTSLPEAFEVKKEMIVKGTLQENNGEWIFIAQEVAVGHPK